MADQYTTSDNVLDPQVLADMLPAKLTAQLQFTAIADIDTTLQGRPGSTVEFPAWNYIGDADDVAEGEGIELSALSYGSKMATIKKVAKGVSLTDEALETGYGDPYTEATSQLAKALANKMDNDLADALRGATQTITVDPTVEGLQNALDVFNDETDAQTVLLVNPTAAGKLRLDAGRNFLSGSELGADTIIKGSYGEILGVQLKRSIKLNKNEAFLVKVNADDQKPALKLMLAKQATIKPDEQPKYGRTDLYGSMLAAAYLYDPTKVVKVTFNGLDASGASNGNPAATTPATEPTNVTDKKKRVGRYKKDTTTPPKA